jgi:hypothetical protein
MIVYVYSPAGLKIMHWSEHSAAVEHRTQCDKDRSRKSERETEREREIYIYIYVYLSSYPFAQASTRSHVFLLVHPISLDKMTNSLRFIVLYIYIYIYVTSLPKLVSQLSTTFASQSPFLQLAKLPLKSQAHPVSPGIA